MSNPVHTMFSRIAGRYDRANRWISFGLDQRVRRQAVALSGARPGDAVLDCAAGTGDLTLAFHAALGGQGRFLGTDFNEDMLAVARSKAAQSAPEIQWQTEDAMALSLDDGSFDVVSIAYGIRNVIEPERALADMYRVLKPGGRLVVVEFGQPSAWVRPFYLLFNRIFVPVVGGLAGGDRAAFRYLQETSDAFPCGQAFVAMLNRSAAWQHVQARPVLFGVNYIYVATRPA